MIINNVQFGVDLSDILNELRAQLAINKIQLLKTMKDTPDNIMVCCPYHKDGQERRPSAGIEKKTGIFHCFTCGEVHTLPEVISFCFGKYDDVLGAFGWEWLLKNFLTVSVEERKDIELDWSRDRKQKTTQYVSEEELDSYRFYHPYMWKRKMTPEVVDIFDIGYDAKTKCITFPVRDESGNTLFIARRSVETKFFNYPQKVEKPLYGLYEVMQLDKLPDEIIICESMIDAITCWVYGKYAFALNGLGTQHQFYKLKTLPFRKYILATDMDEAGLGARLRIKHNVANKLITEYKWDIQIAKDINDMSQEYFNSLKEIL